MQGTVTIQRFNPMCDKEPLSQTFQYPFQPGMTVLDVLNCIRETQDPGLAYDWCCRSGHCGICGITVNGKPTLSCRTAAKPENLRLEPLRNIRVIKDLVIDRDEYERNRPRLRLFLERQCRDVHEPEPIDMREFEHFKIASRCIECFCCVSVCPVYKKKQHLFPGPAAFVLAARHFFDPRDDMNRSLMLCSEGIDLCTECGLCSKACALGVDPGGVIGAMKERIAFGISDIDKVK